MDTLTIDHVSKRFGSNLVLDDISFSVPEHSVFGFLGPNGAGKTTTMKLILGLLTADSGQIRVLQEPVTYGQTKTNRFIGYLPDVPEFYNYMKPLEYLHLCGEITACDPGRIKERSLNLLELVGLASVNKRIGSFSRGMKQRLGIAQALLNEPRLLICDEPTSALDPVGRKEILDILSQVKGQTTVLFSTHILADAERICDRIAVLHKGHLVLNGALDQIKQNRQQDGLYIELESAEDLERFMKLPKLQPFLNGVSVERLLVSLRADDAREAEYQLLLALHEARILPVRLELMEPTLENLFMEVIS